MRCWALGPGGNGGERGAGPTPSPGRQGRMEQDVWRRSSCRGHLPPTQSRCSTSARPTLCGHACGRHLAGQRRLLQGHEHRAQARHVFALLAALGVEVAQLGHLLPLCAWGVLLGFFHKSLLGCPAGGDRQTSQIHLSSPVSMTLCPR